MNPPSRLAVFTVIALLGIVAYGQPPKSDNRVQLVTKVAFTEGPAWNVSEDTLYFSDVANNRIMKLADAGTAVVFREPSGRANGLMFDRQGRLCACEGAGEGGNRRVTRTELDGSITVLTDNFGGKRYNAPNDLTFDSKGRLYFTDPRYGDRSDMQIFDSQGNAVEGVYRVDGDGTVSQILTHEVDRPNGIAISHDDKFLFVADNNNSEIGKNRKLWRFALNADGSVDRTSRKLMFDWGTDRGPDGMTMDRKGTLYVAGGRNYQVDGTETAGTNQAAIYVIDPEDGLIDRIPVPMDDITNCAFGGKDFRTLYVTCGHKIWSIEIDH